MAVRSMYAEYTIKKIPKNISQIISDFGFCETFHWSITTLYAQPKKRIIEFSIILDERSKIKKEEEEKNKRESRMRNNRR